jgi:tetratricopeptide (TPR) repeat protein
LNPYYVEAHRNSAILLAKQGRIDEAITQVQNGLKLEPDSKEFQQALDELQRAKATGQVDLPWMSCIKGVTDQEYGYPPKKANKATRSSPSRPLFVTFTGQSGYAREIWVLDAKATEKRSGKVRKVLHLKR